MPNPRNNRIAAQCVYCFDSCKMESSLNFNAACILPKALKSLLISYKILASNSLAAAALNSTSATGLSLYGRALSIYRRGSWKPTLQAEA